MEFRTINVMWQKWVWGAPLRPQYRPRSTSSAKLNILPPEGAVHALSALLDSKRLLRACAEYADAQARGVKCEPVTQLSHFCAFLFLRLIIGEIFCTFFVLFWLTRLCFLFFEQTPFQKGLNLLIENFFVFFWKFL